MAEKPVPEPEKPTGRKAAPSLRQTAERQQARALRPARGSGFKRVVSAPFRWLGRKLAPMGRFKPLRILGLILWPPYFRNAFRELKLVTWPDRRTTYRLASAVLIFSLLFGLTVAALDWGLDKIFRQVILK